MNMTMELVVAAIVVLIVALVVITIFGGSVTPIGGMTSADSICRTQAKSSCTSGCTMPLTWNLPTVKDASGTMIACSDPKLGMPNTCQGILTGPDASRCSGNP